MPQRLDALAFIMEKVLYSSDGTPLAAHHHAPRLVVTFVTAILKVWDEDMDVRVVMHLHVLHMPKCIMRVCM